MKLAKADSKFEAYIAVFDQGGYRLNYNYSNQGEGVQVNLSAGSIYTVMVKQSSNSGPYCLKVIH